VADQLPLFPLGTVLFPGLVLPLNVFEERYRRLVRDLVTLGEGPPGAFGVVAIRRGWEVERAAPGSATAVDQPDDPVPVQPAPQSLSLTLYDVGCSAEIRQITEQPDGRFELVTVGRQRFRITGVDTEAAPYLVAEVEWLPEEAGEPGVADRLAPAVLAVFRRYLRLIRPDPQQADEQLPDDPTVLSHLVAATAALTLDDRQRLLAVPDTAARLRAERSLLSREVRLLSQVRAIPVPLRELGSPASPN
jgi:Lon protease-like protein